ncbi:MAG: reductive dehalogenase [Dehalogenimonas sp.]|jgi:reductive dehalogenase|uniref:Reductive dehalogenase n=1 Tax=Candidatus Dehalogenimonas loeffleri TaxID=3127115 RepID=A0ABZ2JA52_9CHLR|nr:reductive dehalogenase [Dehalogenimonas sp.]
MSKFHSTISRREFMKGIGLAGAGLGAAAVVAPNFHDLDEVTSSSAQFKHPWYVKEREYDDPTLEIDWNVFERVDRTRKVLGSRFPLTATNGTHATLHPEIAKYRAMKQEENRDIEYMKEKFPSYQGPSLRDYSLTGASGASRKLPSPNYIGEMDGVNIPSPADRGLAKWQGTPEENLQTITNAFKFFGATRVRVMELTDKGKKLVYKNSTGGKPYNFKDADQPEETDSEYVIPNTARYLINYACLEATDHVRQAPAPTYSGYCHGNKVRNNVHYFLGSMGFMHIEAGGFTPAAGVGAFAGTTEHSRSAMLGTSYSHGNLFRWMGRIITDMPLTPTKPIDAGIARFCIDCMTCAHSCPYESMPLGEQRWDHENPEEEAIQNYIPGFKGWRLFNFRCPRCKNCHGACVFNGGNEAIIHNIVRTTQAITPIFNGFFADMETAFGYGTRNPDDWWQREVPTFQFDPTYLY